MTTNFEFKTRLLSNLFFSDTIEIDLINMSSFNYFNVVLKSSSLIMKNEIRQTIKWCKSNNASRSNDILNRIFKIFVNKLMMYLMSLFRICVALNYHSRCFRKIHTIILKKSRKKNYTNVKTYFFVRSRDSHFFYHIIIKSSRECWLRILIQSIKSRTFYFW
jgi:hypothetical protein